MPPEHKYSLPQGLRLRHYLIVRLLGHGGFGLTYLADDTNLHRQVAIKELLPIDFAVRETDGTTVIARSQQDQINLQWARQRFVEEGRMLAALQHPSILQVYDIFELHGTAYLVTAFIDGCNFEEWLRQGRALREEDLLPVAASLLDALQLVHAQGLLHRDVKPENILMDRKTSRPILIDFGNARVATGLKTSNMTAVLSRGYAPMEQYQTKSRQGPFTDLYALGAVFYRAIKGVPPDDALDRLDADHVLKLSEERIPGYSSGFLATIDKALQMRRESRWQSCQEWHEALGSGLQNAASSPAPPHSAPPLASLPPSPARSKRGLVIGALALLALCAAVAGFLIWKSRPQIAIAGAEDSATPPPAHLEPASGLTGFPAPNILTPSSPAPSSKPPPSPAAPLAVIPQPFQPGGTVKVGVLHSLSGSMAGSETSLRDILLFTFDEINKNGGVMGRKIEPVVVDCASNWPLFAERAAQLLERDKVAVTFGCWASVSRKSVLPVFERDHGLLFYPVQYEGEELSKNIFYTGEAVNQQAIPAVDYLLSQGRKKFYLLGSDYVFPRTANLVLHEYLRFKGVPFENIGGGFQKSESGAITSAGKYTPFGMTDYQQVVAEIKRFAAGGNACVINTLSGDTNVAFFQEYAAAGLTAENCPVCSLSIAENELRDLPARNQVGQLGCWTYFMTINSPENMSFLKRWNAWLTTTQADVKKQGRVVDSPMVLSYDGVYLWKEAVEKARSFDVAQVIAELEGGITFDGPGGTVKTQDNHHLTKNVFIGETQANGQFKILKEFKDVPGEPFLLHRIALVLGRRK